MSPDISTGIPGPAKRICQEGLWCADLIEGITPEREQCESEMLARNLSLPLTDRCDWARLQVPSQSWFLAIRNSRGECHGGFAVEARRSRALPGYLILRAERFGGNLPATIQPIAVRALRMLADKDPRILRVNASVFCRSDKGRQTLAELLQSSNFCPSSEEWSSPFTIALDLQPDETDIFASFHRSARRNVRMLDKKPVTLAPITDVRWTERMQQLFQETMSRTGGDSRERDWQACIQLSQQRPDLSRLVGLFHNTTAGPESLLAFAWGCGHGDHAQYSSSASTRAPGINFPLSYALIWDLIRWAKEQGAVWFDLGGVTPGTLGSGDPLGGISDFKRFFCDNVVRVGQDWVHEPRWIQAKLASLVSRGFSCLSRLTSVLRRSGPSSRRSTTQQSTEVAT